MDLDTRFRAVRDRARRARQLASTLGRDIDWSGINANLEAVADVLNHRSVGDWDDDLPHRALSIVNSALHVHERQTRWLLCIVWFWKPS